MVFMRIYCGACGGRWDVYPKIREMDPARICPHCDSRIDGETWRKKVLPAFDAAKIANMAIEEDHTQYHTAPFEVDFIADMRYKTARKGGYNP